MDTPSLELNTRITPALLRLARAVRDLDRDLLPRPHFLLRAAERNEESSGNGEERKSANGHPRLPQIVSKYLANSQSVTAFCAWRTSHSRVAR